MTSIVFVRRFLADYARNPVNLLLLLVVPTVFVVDEDRFDRIVDLKHGQAVPR